MKILITEPDAYSKEALNIYSSLGTVLNNKKLNRQELLDQIEDVDILVIRLGHKIDKEILVKAKTLRAIACPTTGLDHIDIDFAKENNIKIISLNGEIEFLNTITATAELAWGLMLALIRQIPWAYNSVKVGNWDRDSFKGVELRGKTLGVIGCGRLGKMMSQYGNAFFMNVVAYDPHINRYEIEKSGAEPMLSLEELLKVSDFITLHIPLDDFNKKIISEKEFNIMKDTAYLVNTSRGAIIDELAMLDALKTKKIAGVAIDVLNNEEVSGNFLKDNPLLEYSKINNNLLITPHIGGATHDSMWKTEIFIANKVKQNF